MRTIHQIKLQRHFAGGEVYTRFLCVALATVTLFFDYHCQYGLDSKVASISMAQARTRTTAE